MVTGSKDATTPPIGSGFAAVAKRTSVSPVSIDSAQDGWPVVDRDPRAEPAWTGGVPQRPRTTHESASSKGRSGRRHIGSTGCAPGPAADHDTDQLAVRG